MTSEFSSENESDKTKSVLEAAVTAALQDALPKVTALLGQALPKVTAALEEALPKALEEALPVAIRRTLAHTMVIAAKAYNRTSGSGKSSPYEPVPFPDGSLPSEHDLPHLDTYDTVQGLSHDDLISYCNKYCPGNQVVDDDECRRLVRVAIGCTT